MKKIVIVFALLFTCLINAQESEKMKYPQDVNKKHEVKLNAFSLIAFSSFDISYERVLNKDSSFGVAVFYNFGGSNDDIDFPKKFSLTPYYRWFFTETRFARGFFVEGFGSLNTYEDTVFSSNFNSGNTNSTVVSETDFAIGISVGGKFVISSGFTAEIYLGLGRNLINDESDFFFENSVITRGGISLGYRF